MRHKLYRDHRGGLAESLETAIEVNGIEDIREHVLSDPLIAQYYKNIHISHNPIEDNRMGDEWNLTYYVLADVGEYKNQCVGMCNFCE
jgi:hypothetical protein